MTDILVTQQTV